MDIYLVGGAVRDELLGLPVRERDWVVVGATPAQMERAGYRLVGRDFPVFLHPDTHEEYALARVERKTGPGYHGFSVHCAPDVTLEEDLRRRDLTINAIARGGDGTLHDPYGGRADLEGRWLRHVSEAFSEDPVRILRVARFAARFAELGFRVEPSTQALMRTMVGAGEAGALVAERVWAETAKALRERHPGVYFEVLAQCGALAVVYPELHALADDRARWDAARAALDGAARSGHPERVRFAAFLACTEDPALVDALCVRVRVPTDYRDLAVAAARHRAALRTSAPADGAAILALLESLDAFRRGERFDDWLAAVAAAGVSPGIVTRLRDARAIAAGVALEQTERELLRGPAIGARLRALRIDALDAVGTTDAAH